MTKNDQKWRKTIKIEKNGKKRKKTRTLKVSRIYGDLSLKYGAFFSCFFRLFFLIFHDFSWFFEFFHLFSSFSSFWPIQKNDPPMDVCMYIYIYMSPPIFTGGVKFWDEIFGSKTFLFFIIYFLFLFLIFIFYFIFYIYNFKFYNFLCLFL